MIKTFFTLFSAMFLLDFLQVLITLGNPLRDASISWGIISTLFPYFDFSLHADIVLLFAIPTILALLLAQKKEAVNIKRFFGCRKLKCIVFILGTLIILSILPRELMLHTQPLGLPGFLEPSPSFVWNAAVGFMILRFFAFILSWYIILSFLWVIALIFRKSYAKQ